MKIESHEIAMQSQHTEYKSILESQMSFSTFFDTTPPTELQNIEQAQIEEPKESDISNFFTDNMRTISEIIQNLIKMLQDRTSKISTDEEEVNGYTHLSFYEKYEEHESLDFSTIGEIKTDKGSLNINLNFSMSRSFIVENRIDVYSTFDPLVINLDGDIPNLSDDTFSFDLDNDGESEQISTLEAGSGFLALDKNLDGIINQGSELFGTLTGNGFGELSTYDDDKNNWIDENDSIFDKLQIWLKNEDTNEKELVGLGEVGIGAIFLDSQQSEFTYKTQTNQTLGEIKSCGIFLNENGSCGNISQIDFASRKAEDTQDIAKINTSEPEPLAILLQA